MAGKEVVVRILGDADKLKAAFGEADKAGQSFSDKMSDAGKKMQSVGKKMTVALTLPIVGAGVAAFKMASDMGESLSKVGVVFGDNAKEIEKWSMSSAKNMGIARQEALESVGTFGNLFKALGVGSRESTDMSKKLVELASDLASFNNADPKEVLESLKSGLLGQAEPMRKFGSSLSAARIEAEALSMGLAKGNVDMLKVKTATAALDAATKNHTAAVKEFGPASEQAAKAQLQMEVAERKVQKAMEGSKAVISDSAKAQAAYSIMVKDTSLAHGDFERTADGAANKQRTVMASFKDTAAVLGEQLLPIGLKLMEWVGSLIDKFSNLSPNVQKFVLIGAGLLAVLGPIVAVVGTLVTVIGFLASPIGLVVLAIAALVAGFIWAYKNVEWFRNAVNAALGFVADSAVWLGKVFSAVWGGIVSGFVWVRDTLRSIANWLVANVINRFIDGINLLIKGYNAVNIGGKDLGMLGKLPQFHQGGVIPGPVGTEVAILAQAGETVVPIGGNKAGGGTTIINVAFNGVTTRETADQVVRILEQHFARGGALGNGRGGTLAPA